MAVKKKAGWESGRALMIVSGDSGSGKSFFVANLKSALIYDTDIGGGLAYADARIERNGSQRVEEGSWIGVLSDIKRRIQDGSLANIKTIVVDHATQLHQEAAIRHNPLGERDYGRGASMASREWVRFRELVRKLKINLIVTAHLKQEWEKEEVKGLISDAAKSIERDMGIVVYLKHNKELPPTKDNPTIARTIKWRRDPDDSRGEVPPAWPFTAEEFEKIAGSGMMAEVEPVKFASPEQVTRLEKAMKKAGLPTDIKDGWLTKAAAESLDELTEDQITKCIAYCDALVAAK